MCNNKLKHEESTYKIEQILEEIPLSELFDTQIQEYIQQECIKILEQQVLPKQLKQTLFQIPLTIARIESIVLELKQHKLIDTELTSLLCISLKRAEKSIQDKEELDLVLNLIEHKLTKLVSRKQIEPQLAKVFILLLAVMKAHIKS
jgi:hypothetical protein